VPGKRGCSQANRITLTNTGRRDNPPGDNFPHRPSLVGVGKRSVRSLKSFTHEDNDFRFEERSGIGERTDWHGHYLPHRRLLDVVTRAGLLRIGLGAKCENIKAIGKTISLRLCVT
jgi:hypothetical protein